MKTKYLFGVCVSFTLSILSINLFAQQQNLTKPAYTKEDSAAFNALVLYPDTIRLDIFEACQYPAAIVNIASIQKNSGNEFARIVSSYSKDGQEELWNLGRYPDLISKLVQGGVKSEQEINAIVSGYPDETRKSALKYGRNDFEVLQKIDNLQRESSAQFEQTIADYPQITKDAYRELIGFPEIMNLLNDHLNFAVRVGDRYRRDPQRVIHRMDSLNLVAVRQNLEELQAWKDSVQKNPEELKDLKNAANEYAQDNGYTQDEINTSPPPQYVYNYVSVPYSYWFGYPTWYPYYYWYPYPFWFDCGFYYDMYGNIVIIGMPSYYFTNWYFYYPHHWHHYPHLCNGYIRHYYGPRHSTSSNSLIVRGWVSDNHSYLPEDFISNPTRRVEAIQQVGQLNIDALKEKGGSSVSPEVRDQYYEKNSTKYPALKHSAEPIIRPDVKQRNIPEIREEPIKQPPVRIQKEEPRNVPTPKPTPTPTPKPAVEPRKYNFEQINKAQDYHRNTWEQAQPTPRQSPSVVRPQPPIRQTPVPQPPGKKK